VLYWTEYYSTTVFYRVLGQCLCRRDGTPSVISLLTDNHLIERLRLNLALITGVLEKATATGTAVPQHDLLEVNS